jgi:acetyl esterase/lipase
MRRALILLALPLLIAGAAAAPDDGWQQAGPDNARPAPPQLRSESMPTPRPDPSAGWQQASNSGPRTASPPPPLRSDAPLPTPRPDPRGYGPLKVSFPGNITGTFDIPYQTLKGFRPLTLDIYQPPARSYPLPLVVFVHGGGFGGGDSRHAAVFDDMPATMAGLAAQGYVVASVNYRLSGEARFPAAVQDIKAAIRFLRNHADEMGLDVTRAALWGVSTGGQLASLAGVSCGVPLFAPAGAPDQSDCVQAVVDWYGPVDAPTAELLGCEPAACLPGAAKTANPLTYIGVTSPPFLIEQGAADKLVPPADAQKLATTLKASNVAVDLVVWPNVGHDFAGQGGPDPATTRQALQRMAAFLANVFPPGVIGAKARPPRGPVYQ